MVREILVEEILQEGHYVPVRLDEFGHKYGAGGGVVLVQPPHSMIHKLHRISWRVGHLILEILLLRIGNGILIVVNHVHLILEIHAVAGLASAADVDQKPIQ